jgi:hypothetical protein
MINSRRNSMRNPRGKFDEKFETKFDEKFETKFDEKFEREIR